MRHSSRVTRLSLPPDLGLRFSVAQATTQGVGRARLRSPDLTRPFHGVRVVGSESLTHVDAVRAYATRMTANTFFSHLSAAVCWGLPIPESLLSGDVDVAVLAPRRAPEGRGVRGRVVRAAHVSVQRHPRFDIPLSSPASTWAQLASVIGHPYDLVAIADALVRGPQHRNDPPPLATLEQLECAVSAGRRVGVRELRRALPRIRGGVSSRPETWLRLTIVDAGLPEPVPAHVVRDADGRFAARLDLAYPAASLGLEYEGEHHLADRGQWYRDIERYERLADLGWRIVRVTAADLFAHPGALAKRVREALAQSR